MPSFTVSNSDVASRVCAKLQSTGHVTKTREAPGGTEVLWFHPQGHPALGHDRFHMNLSKDHPANQVT